LIIGPISFLIVLDLHESKLLIIFPLALELFEIVLHEYN
jgi:hypothetical protein